MSTCATIRPPTCSCRLCNTETLLCMDIFGVGIASNISAIIQQHFGIKVLINDVQKSSRICFKCWTITENFHNLYNMVVTQIDSELSNQIDVQPTIAMAQFETAVLDDVAVKSELPNDIDEELPTCSDAVDIFVLENDADITIKNEPLQVEEYDNEDADEEMTTMDTHQEAETADSAVKNAKGIVNMNSLAELVRKFCSMSCELCTTTFQTLAEAKMHYFQEHNQIGYIRCCGKKIFKSGQAIDHLQVHFDPDFFRCEPCNKTFLTRDGLRFHNRNHHKSASITCLLCPERFKNRYFFEKHIRTAHDVNGGPAKPEDADENALILKYMSLKCDLCPESFVTVRQLFSHYCRAHDQPGYVRCCLRRMTRIFDVSEHARWHQDPHVYRCETCNKSYNSSGNLRTHVKAVHSEKKCK